VRSDYSLAYLRHSSYMGKEEHRVQIEEMVKAIKENREPLVNGEEGRKTVEIISAIYKSSRTERPVKFPLK